MLMVINLNQNLEVLELKNLKVVSKEKIKKTTLKLMELN